MVVLALSTSAKELPRGCPRIFEAVLAEWSKALDSSSSLFGGRRSNRLDSTNFFPYSFSAFSHHKILLSLLPVALLLLLVPLFPLHLLLLFFFFFFFSCIFWSSSLPASSLLFSFSFVCSLPAPITTVPVVSSSCCSSSGSSSSSSASPVAHLLFLVAIIFATMPLTSRPLCYDWISAFGLHRQHLGFLLPTIILFYSSLTSNFPSSSCPCSSHVNLLCSNVLVYLFLQSQSHENGIKLPHYHNRPPQSLPDGFCFVGALQYVCAWSAAHVEQLHGLASHFRGSYPGSPLFFYLLLYFGLSWWVCQHTTQGEMSLVTN